MPLGDKLVVLAGDLAVVWYEAYDTLPDAPKRVYDLYTNNDLLDDFIIRVNVEGKDMWILGGERQASTVYLTRYTADGSEIRYDIPGDLNEALRPAHGVPSLVWARAVSEAHQRVCQGTDACFCREQRQALDKSGLLL
jgi:hypothetical protein